MILITWPIHLLAAIMRTFFQTVPLAFGQVWANKVRAILTALGIIIGIGAVITVVGALNGMERNILDQFEKFGAKKMSVRGWVPRELRGIINWDDTITTADEAQLIADNANTIAKVSPVAFLRGDVLYGKNSAQGSRVVGIWPTWHDIENRPIKYGRPFNQIDDKERRPVCILNEAAIEELQLPLDPTGETILLSGRRFRVVGVVESNDVSMQFGGGEANTEVYIPHSTALVLEPDPWAQIACEAISAEVANEAQLEIEFILRRARGLRGEDVSTFRVEAIQSRIEDFKKNASIMRLVSLIVVAISLLVGGIGIMNIMLVSVSERTREIGLRKALGAQPIVVLMQFLVEAIVLCLVGGAVGVALGYGGATAIFKAFPDFGEAFIPPEIVAVALGFSASVGVLFGMFPAIKAALLNPIDALRHE